MDTTFKSRGLMVDAIIKDKTGFPFKSKLWVDSHKGQDKKKT